MALLVKCFIFVVFVAAIRAASLPFEDSPDVIYVGSPVMMTNLREKRSPFPGRAMMFHGYFGAAGHPYHSSPRVYNRPYGRSDDPQGTMTAFAAGDSVAAGSSYYGNGGGQECTNCHGPSNPANGNGVKQNGNGNGHVHPGNGDEYPTQDVPIANGNANGHKPADEQENGYPTGNGNGAGNEIPARGNGNGGDDGYLGDQPAAEEAPKEEALPPADAPVQPAASETPKKIPDVSDEEEDEPSFFSHKPRGQGPFYNSYFPMVFGAYPGRGGGRGSGEEGAYNPGVATAIANSFSTGRGAVATSHATAYGSPQFVPGNGYRKNGSKSRPH